MIKISMQTDELVDFSLRYAMALVIDLEPYSNSKINWYLPDSLYIPHNIHHIRPEHFAPDIYWDQLSDFILRFEVNIIQNHTKRGAFIGEVTKAKIFQHKDLRIAICRSIINHQLGETILIPEEVHNLTQNNIEYSDAHI